MVSVNQVRHLFVANEVVDTTPTTKGQVKVCEDVKHGVVFLQYMGEGGLLTSDYIKKDQVLSLTNTTGASARVNLKEALLTLSEPLEAGQDYIVDIMIQNYIAMADESTLVKFGAVHATSTMTESEFYVAMAKSFARNFSRDINKFFKFYLTTASSYEEVTVNSAHIGTAYTGIKIVEQPQTDSYVVGEYGVTTVNFSVVPHTILSNGDEVNPFVVKENGTVAITDKVSRTGDTVTYIGNGYEIADTEYFCMGERGDMYRQMGYPRTIRTKYMVEPTQEYDVLDLAFYFVGRGIDAQKSEKLLTVVGNTATISDLESNLKDALGVE